MRVLLVTTAGLGHIHPMVPLAQAFMARGHEVLWAAPADGVPAIERAAIPAVVAGPARLAKPTEVSRRYPEIAALPPVDVPDATFGKLFGLIVAPAMLPELEAVASRWRPSLVVADAAALAGHIVAAMRGVPCVTKGFGPILPERRVARAGEDIADLWRSRGLEPQPYGGSYQHLYLDVYPPELQLEPTPHIPHRQLLQPVTYNGDAGAAGDFALPSGPPDWPLVYVTMGTVFNDPEPLRTALAALGGLDVRVLVTVGPHADPAVLGPQPKRVRVERYVPQSELLPLCDLVISHGGSGTVLASLTLGLPQLCLPQGADQFLNGAALASAGAGISLMPAEATAEEVGRAVGRLLTDSSFRDAAGRVGASIAAMPPPDEVVQVLETLP